MSRLIPSGALAVLILVLGVTSAGAGINEWTANGPLGGLMESLALDPTNPDTLYAGTFNGTVWKSTDAGANWAVVGNLGARVTAIVIDPSNPNVVHASAFGVGVLKSTDAGATWRIAIGLSETQIQTLILDPVDPGTLYVGTAGRGIFKSTDSGAGWFELNEGLTDLDVQAVAVDPTNAMVVYAATDGGVFKTIDGGLLWSRTSSGLTTTNVRTLAIDPADPAVVYAGTSGGIFRTVNGAATWQPIMNGMGSVSVRALALATAAPATLYAGTFGDGVFKTTDGGENWAPAPNGLAANPVLGLAVNPLDADVLYAGLEGSGVFRSADGGAIWTATNNGLIGTEVLAVAVDPADSAILYAGTFGAGVFKSENGGVSWAAASTGLGDDSVRALAIHTAGPETLFAGTFTAGVFKSSDGGDTWTAVNDGLTNLDIRSLLTNVDGAIFAGTGGGGIFRSIDDGASWAAANNGLSDLVVQALGISPQVGLLAPPRPPVLFAGTLSGGVFRSTDGGDSWNVANNGLPPSEVRALVNTVGSVFVGTDRGVFQSITDGGNWFPVHDGLSDLRVRALAASEDGFVYAGTPSGAFRLIEGGGSVSLPANPPPFWEPLDRGLAVPDVLALVVDPSDPGRLFAGTGGGGVFGLTQVATSVRGVVWADTDGDGIRDSGEVGVDGVVVHLNAEGGERSEVTESTVDGSYRFDDLVPGAYRVEILLPDRFFHSPADQGSDDVDSDVDPASAQTALLVVAAGSDIVADAGLVPASEIGDLVWHDENTDGIVNEGEGLPGMSVFLLAPDGTLLDVTTTNTQGFYHFSDLTTGDYLVEFELAAGYLFSPRDQGDDDEFDSDADPATGRTGIISLGVGERDLSVDAGMFLLGSVAGAAWHDTDGNGVRTSGEDLLEGIEVRLLAADLTFVENATTSAEGYRFDGLRPGVYFVEFTLPTGLDFSPQDVGGNAGDDHDSDADTVTGRVGPLVVSSGAALTNVDAGMTARRDLTVLDLRDGRFTLEVEWRDFEGSTGPGTVATVGGPPTGGVPLASEDSAVLEFFGEDNWEMLIKVLDGRLLNGNFWVFLASATDVAFETTVTDTSCGQTRTYENRAGEAAPAITDVEAFSECEDPQPPSCLADEDTLCLGEDGRFRLEVRWTDFDGVSGVGRQVLVPEPGLAKGEDSGLFYFFSADNWEFLVKVLDGCGFNDHFWVFGAATTNVEYTLRVTDNVSGEVRSYTNPLGNAADALTDTMAFATCDEAP